MLETPKAKATHYANFSRLRGRCCLLIFDGVVKTFFGANPGE